MFGGHYSIYYSGISRFAGSSNQMSPCEVSEPGHFPIKALTPAWLTCRGHALSLLRKPCQLYHSSLGLVFHTVCLGPAAGDTDLFKWCNGRFLTFIILSLCPCCLSACNAFLTHLSLTGRHLLVFLRSSSNVFYTLVSHNSPRQT